MSDHALEAALDAARTGGGLTIESIVAVDPPREFRVHPRDRVVAYTADVGGARQLFTLSLRGTGAPPTQLTASEQAISDPQWSPDGRRLAFVRDGEIWLIEADGSRLVRVVAKPGGGRDPRWSPDGQKILFTSNVNGAPQVFIMAADGNNTYQLTHSDYVLRDAIWSLDGQQILYTSMLNGIPNGTPEFYIINLDGSTKRRLTFNSWYIANPAWQP